VPARKIERGTAVVEFALVLPLVLVLTLALVEVGLLARDRLLVEAAARAGARAAAVQDDEAAIREAALAAAPGLDPSLVSLQVSRTGARGEPVSVAVGYDDPVRLPAIAWLFGTTVRLDATAVDRQEFG
jgi:Flp pilus assembly protein TadG